MTSGGSRVPARRDGNWTHYRIREPDNKKAVEFFAGVMEVIKNDPEMKPDHLHLANVCCAPAPVNIQSRRKLETK